MPQEVLDQFEKETGTRVRAELVTSSIEVETRLKASPRLWDVVIDSHSLLVSLAHQKLFKLLPENLGQSIQKSSSPLFWNQFQAQGTDVSRYLVPLQLNPWGFLWKSKSLPLESFVGWENATQKKLTPLWRGRLLFPNQASPLLQSIYYMTRKDVQEPNSSRLKSLLNSTQGLQLLYRMDKQGRPVEHFLLHEFAQDTVAAAFTTKWQAQKVQRLIKDSHFAVPKEVTLYHYFALAIPDDTVRLEKALQFVQFCMGQNAKLVQFNQMPPINAAESSKSWQLYDEYFMKYLDKQVDLSKLKLDHIKL